ncbi:MAG: endonuclease III, partial [Thermoplasmataceae archaeon]
MDTDHARKLFLKIYPLIQKQSPPHHFEFTDPFWVLITTMLSHRTKDEVTDAAARALHNRYINMEGLAGAKYEDVLAIIDKVGFKRAKADRIIRAAGIIMEKFGGRVPEELDLLTTIPGVGRKTANVVLADSMGKPAIAVDTHVHRISNRIGLCSTRTPEETEEELRKIIPENMWVGFNPTMVEFGKHVCKPVGPRCDKCLIV